MRNEVYKGRRNHPANGLMAMLVVLSLTVGACSDNATVDGLADGVIRVTAEAALKGDAAQTRTDYTEVANGGMTVKWTTGDAFQVFQGDTQQTFTLQKTDSDGKGHFSGTLTSGTATTTLYALYPAAAVSSSTTTASGITLSVADQTQADNNSTAHLSVKDFMRATYSWDGKTADINFGEFAHLMAVLRLDIELPATTTNTIASIVLSGMNAKQTLDLTKDPAMEGVWKDGQSGDITLTTTNGTPDGDKKYTAYLMVFPTTTLKTLTITVNLTGDTSYTKKFTSNTGIVLNAGKRYWITVKDLNKVGGGSLSEDMGGGGNTGTAPLD